MQMKCIIGLALLTGVDGAEVRFLRDRHGVAITHHQRDQIPQMTLDHDVKLPDANSLAKWIGDDSEKGPVVMDGINQFRAQICWQMKDEHGKHFDSFEACKKFMKDACKPGGDGEMDGDGKEITSEHGYCQEYFPKEKKEKKEKKAEEEAPKAEKVVKEAAQEEGKKGQAGGSPGAAPSPAAAPAPAPAPGPVVYPKDEAWYWKNGGKDEGRYHMNEKLKLPTQGYWGKLVEHEDMKTATSDWQSEVGANDPHTLEQICHDHPDNAWCREKGYNNPYNPFNHMRSGSLTLAVSVTPILLMFAATMSLM